MSKFYPEGFLYETKENAQAIHSPLSLADAYAKGEILEARAVMCDAQHNLLVDLNGVTGIIPREEGAIGIADGSVRDIAIISRVGRPVSFIITAFNAAGGGAPTVILSRRAAQQQCVEQYIRQLRCGDVIDAVVTHLEPFGAFCDIGCGVSSLLPIDSISVSRISHPADRFNTSDRIKAVVKVIDGERITLSQKELLGSWEENAQLFSQGQTVSGIVRSIESYGIFVELTPNLAGLAETKLGVQQNDTASVYIKSIIPEKMKIKLIIIDSFAAPSVHREPKYFTDSEHIEEWDYSPISARKLIKTRF